MVVKVVKCPEARSVDGTKEKEREEIINTKRMFSHREECSI